MISLDTASLKKYTLEYKIFAIQINEEK